MIQRRQPVREFIDSIRVRQSCLIDSRSESEFQKGHIPGAINIPLLKNEERRIIGTLYKSKGREAAVLKGFELVGPRFHTIIEEVSAQASDKNVFMYCWRGGMRSNIMGWLLSMAGFRVTMLEGGYKTFRRWALDKLNEPRDVIVLGGKTGSGKTEILNQLSALGEQVIDLEAHAHHKGSAFGALGQPPQPSTEHFENLLAWEWDVLDPEKRVWLENESRNIGACMIPASIFELIRESPLIEIEIPVRYRRERISKEYGKFPFNDLSEATIRIGKRLGPVQLKEALWNLGENNFDEWLRIVLSYYDKLYGFGTAQRQPGSVTIVPVESNDTFLSAEQVIAGANQLLRKHHE